MRKSAETRTYGRIKPSRQDAPLEAVLHLGTTHVLPMMQTSASMRELFSAQMTADELGWRELVLPTAGLSWHDFGLWISQFK